MTNAEFFLQMARDEFERLRACPPPVVLGDDTYSAHFTHAVICSTFSAFAVEHALTELIWVRCFFQTPEPYRRVALQHASALRSVAAKLEFIRTASKIPADLIDDIGRLFQYRNRIAHCTIKTSEGKALGFEETQDLIERRRGCDIDNAIELALRGKGDALKQLADEAGKEISYLQLVGLSTEDLEAAEQNVHIAERALQALRREMESDEWPSVRPG